MICYRDKTFCTANCKRTECPDKYTEQVKKDAIEWWGNDNAPVMVADMSKGCEDFMPEDIWRTG